METYQSSSARNIDMCPVFPSIPLHSCREETCFFINPVMATNSFRVAVQYDFVGSRHVDSDTVVAEASVCVEVEDKNESCPLKYNYLVSFVLQGDISLGRVQPAILCLAVIHQLVEGVQEFVSKQVIFGEVELSTGIPKGIVVSFSREIQPFRMAKFVAFKVEVTLSTQTMSKKSNHLVQCDSTINHWRQWR